MGVYITFSDLSNDKTLEKAISYTNWIEGDFEVRIAEAESYVEGRLLKIGYTREQLLTAPAVYELCKLYCYYAIVRDIYTQTSPGKGSEERYDKWKKSVDDWLEKIENMQIALADTNGNIIQAVNTKYKAKITTALTKRMITLDKPESWNIDETNYSEDVIGEK